MSSDGWHQDPRSLKPVLDDEATFRRAHASDVALDALVLLFGGKPSEAEVELRRLLDEDPENRRVVALLADARRDQGHVDEAAATYAALIANEVEPARRATFVQHLGKTHVAAGNLADAQRCFAEALRERRRLGVPGRQVGDSRLMGGRPPRALWRRRWL